jgi:sporulation protein YunB
VIIFFKDISTQIAVSDASDIVTAQVNQIVADIMAEQDYSADYFISLEKNESGEITAINSNMARINALSAEILTRVIGVTESRVIEVGIPAGNLSGISMLMGRGPDVTVDIVMLTSSRVEFNNTIVTAGINQTKHQINLDITVDVDVLVPWGMESNQVVTEILIADTTIVGQVPETYLNVQ